MEETAISFETETPSEAEFAERILIYGESPTWLVAEGNNQLDGYAYGSPHRPRAAYRCSAGILAYLHPDFRGIGVFPEYGRKFDQWHNTVWWYRPPNLENETAAHLRLRQIGRNP